MPSPYELPTLPFSFREVHLPSIPEVLRDYGLCAARGYNDGDATLPMDGAAQAARERIEVLVADTWNEYQGVSRQPDGLSRLMIYRDHAERVLSKIKGSSDDNEVVGSVVRYRNDVLMVFLDLLVAKGELPRWIDLEDYERDAVFRTVRSPTISPEMADYLHAGSRVHLSDRGQAGRFTTWTEVYEAIRSHLTDAVRYRGHGRTEVSTDAIRKRFERAEYRTTGGPGNRPDEEEVRVFLSRLDEAWEGYQALGGGEQ